MPNTHQSDAGFSAVELLTVAAVVAVLGALSVPLMGNMLGAYRLSGDARTVSNQLAVAKMRAASLFTQTRLRVNIAARTFQIENWQKTGTPGWVPEGELNRLSTGVTFGSGSAAVAPPNTQTTIGQSPTCKAADGSAIAGTSCVIFNSRGLPVDDTGAPIGTDAFYLTDGTAVFGATVSATGMMRLWRTPAHTTPTWSLQ